MSLNVGSSHVEIGLHKKWFSHVNIRSISHLLSIKKFCILVIISHEELFVLAFKFIERRWCIFSFLFVVLLDLNVDFWLILWGFIYASLRHYCWLGYTFVVWLRLFVFEPSEQWHGSFIIIQSLVEFSFIKFFISFFSELVIGHKAWTAFQISHFFVVLAVEEQSVL